MPRLHDNSSAKEHTFLDRPDSRIHANDPKRSFPQPHTYPADVRYDQNVHAHGQAAGPSRASNNPTSSNHYGFDVDYITHTNIQQPQNESSYYYAPSSLEVPSADTHPYSADASSLPVLPPQTAPPPKISCYAHPLVNQPRDLDQWAAYSPPATSDVSGPASSFKSHPSELKIQTRRPSISQQHPDDFPSLYSQVINPSNSANFPHNDEQQAPRLGPNGLAEDQPPTAQGKLRTRVYVACLQCRSRKIRCDGAKPKCQKCLRRSNDCDYDAAPKRRGPDKRPGARQRTSKKVKAVKEDTRGAEHQSEVAAKNEPVEEISSSLNPVPGPDSDPLLPLAHTLLPLQHYEPYDLDAHRGSVSSSAEYPLPTTPVDGPEVTLSLSSASTHAEAPNASFRPERVDESRRFLRLLPESTLPSNKPSLNPSLGSNYNSTSKVGIPNKVLSRVDFVPPYHEQHSQILPLPDDEYHDQEEIVPEPSLDYSRKTWWDSLLAVYVPGCDRATSSRQIMSDLRFLFRASNYFFSFINVPLFFSTFCNPLERDKMQPSLVLSILAMSVFMRSSEIDQGNAGRMHALWLRDAAQSSLEASMNARWLDPTLGQAAWLLSLFELCTHPLHCAERANSAMVILDSIIRSLRLTSIDEHDFRVSRFDSSNAPVVQVPASTRVASKQGCCCASLTLGHNSPASHQHTPLWVATAAWNPDWTVAEIRKEESRRLCWSALQVAAGHTAHAAAFSIPFLDLHCIQPSNYSLLFPGEALLQSPSYAISHSPKESIWALYSRTMLLWNSCLRMRENPVSDAEKVNFAVNAWIESTVIEDALNAHTCGCDQAFMFQGREFLFITRMCISYEFRRFIPHPESDFDGLFNRRKAEEWLVKQASIAKRVMQGLHTVTGHKNNVLAQRPFFIWWFMGQVARSLMLWQLDNSLTIALEVCEAFFAPIDYLSCLWPCPMQREHYLNLHARLCRACQVAGLPSPPLPNFDLFAPGSPPVPVV